MMRKLHYLFLAFLILTIYQSFPQDYGGIWISSYKKETRKVKERVDVYGKEIKMIKLDSVETDIFYNDIYILLDFLDDSNLIIRGIGNNKQIKCKYSVKNGKLKIKFEKGKIKSRISNNLIVITDKVNKSTTEEIFFEKINESNLTDTSKLDDNIFKNSNWIISTDNTSFNYGINLRLFDNDMVIISQDYGEYGYTNWGEWKTDLYMNHFFLIFTDAVRADKRVYHFFDRKNSTLIGNTFERPDFTKEPLFKDIQFTKIDLLNRDQQLDIESKLVGKWKAFNNPIPFDTAFSSDTLINQRFEIDFNSNNKFEIMKSGVIIKDSIESKKNTILSGDWKISDSGKYIEIKPLDGWIRHMTISKLTEDYLEIFYRVRGLEKDRYGSNRTIKMKKY